MVIQVLPWDSAFFRKKIGAIFLDGNLIPDREEILSSGKESSFDVVYGFLHVMEGKNYNPEEYRTDYRTTNVTYSQNLIGQEYIIWPQIKTADPYKDLNALKELAYLAGHSSRFLKDKNFGENAGKSMYDVWIQNSLNKEIADEVFIYQTENIAGFVSVKINNDIASIGLLSVEEKSRGQNIGAKLLQAANFYAIQKKCKSIEVSTQIENISACNFYEKNGFKPINKTEIYHFWI